jgi:hypothetical protein
VVSTSVPHPSPYTQASHRTRDHVVGIVAAAHAYRTFATFEDSIEVDIVTRDVDSVELVGRSWMDRRGVWGRFRMEEEILGIQRMEADCRGIVAG